MLMIALLAGLVASLATSGTALAGRSVCRTDPVVTLTDGTVLDLWATVETERSNINRIEYTLHAPPGSRVLLVAYTGGLLGVREHFTLQADAAPGEYWTDTVVYTNNQGVASSVQAEIVSLTRGISVGSASGNDHEHLIIRHFP
jgi:hypothetical protein